ncbi:4-trimethylaminobutyraldehyde dehydrogenase-like [Branchiostoma floridae x Branchiostoma japonicum]
MWLQQVVVRGVQIAGRRGVCTTVSNGKLPLHFNYINGERVSPLNPDPTQIMKVLEPATGDLLIELQTSGPDEVNRAVQSAKEAFTEWSQLTGLQRGRIMQRAAQIIKDRQEEFAYWETRDTGKPIYEARMDIWTAIDAIEYFSGLAPTIAGQHVPLANGSFAYTKKEPLGVCAGIGAWNYPIQMAGWKSAPALACGNTFVFKPSQFTPITAVMLGEVYTEAGLPHGCYNVVQGAGETGTLLCEHSDVAKVSFTGSVPTGSKVMAAAAGGIKTVTLELGGKSPLIVFADANLDNAVGGAMLGNFLSQGEVCSNATRVFVENSVMDQFLARLVERTGRMKVGDPMDDDTRVGAMIHQDQADKVMTYLDGAKKEGAVVACGGELVTPDDPRLKGCYISPCVLTNCHDDMTVVREEVFGPVVSILGFDTEEEVIQRANNTEFGLAGGVFTNDLTRAHRVIAQMQAGTCYINNFNIIDVAVPFGGFKKSGLGRENGLVTVEYYTQVKTVYVEMGDVDAPF